MPICSTHRDASNGGIDISGKCNFDHFLTKHRFRVLDFLIENYIFIEKTTVFLGYRRNGYHIRIRRIEKIRMDEVSAHTHVILRLFIQKSVFTRLVRE